MDKVPMSPQQRFFDFRDKGTRPAGPPFFLFHTDRGSMGRGVRFFDLVVANMSALNISILPDY